MQVHHNEIFSLVARFPGHIKSLATALVKHPIAAWFHKFFLGFYFTGVILYWFMERLLENKDPNITRWEHVKKSTQDYFQSLRLSARKEWNQNTWQFFAAAFGMLTSVCILVGLFVYGQAFFWASTLCIAGCYYAWHKAAAPKAGHEHTYQSNLDQASNFTQFISVLSFGAALILLDIVQATSISLPFGQLFSIAILTAVGLGCAFISTATWFASFFFEGDKLVNPFSKIKIPTLPEGTPKDQPAFKLECEPEFKKNNNPYLPSSAYRRLGATDSFHPASAAVAEKDPKVVYSKTPMERM